MLRHRIPLSLRMWVAHASMCFRLREWLRHRILLGYGVGIRWGSGLGALGSAQACSCQALGTLETVGAARPKRRLRNIHLLQPLDMAQASDLDPQSHMADTTGPGILVFPGLETVRTLDVTRACDMAKSVCFRHWKCSGIGFCSVFACCTCIHVFQASGMAEASDPARVWCWHQMGLAHWAVLRHAHVRHWVHMRQWVQLGRSVGSATSICFRHWTWLRHRILIRHRIWPTQQAQASRTLMYRARFRHRMLLGRRIGAGIHMF